MLLREGVVVSLNMDEFGWNIFFLELRRVLESCQFQMEVDSERYANYIVERLESWLRNVYTINEIFTIGCEPENELDPEEEAGISRYKAMTDELSSCILSLS